jgi:hypothetical protein
MARTFRMDTSASPTWLLARARRVASENGVTLVGDEGSGRYSHDMFRGEARDRYRSGRLPRACVLSLQGVGRLVGLR